MARSDPQENGERLSLETIERLLSTRRLGRAAGRANELWEEIESTNDRAAALAAEGAPEGVLVVARQQTAGRGRLGRTWVSPPDAGVYVSVLLRPDASGTNLPLHTIACGVACVKAIWECAGLQIGLKWVNDLVANGKKLGGILAEIPSSPAGYRSAATGQQRQSIALVLGAGINLRLDPGTLPEELRDRVESLENLAGQPVNPNLLVACLARHLEQTLDLMAAGRAADVLDAWRQHSVTLGRPIKATSGSLQLQGLAVDIDESGGLIVDTVDRGRTTLHAGEITIRNPDGTYA